MWWLGSWARWPEPKWAKILPHFRSHPQEKQNPKFFSLQSRRLATSCVGLNSSVAQLTELWHCKVVQK